MSDSTGRQFFEQTKYKHLADSDQYKGMPAPPFEHLFAAEGAPIPLPDPASLALEPLDLPALIERRVSRRQYAQDPLSLAELSFLLWSTQGIKITLEGVTKRTVPSAGARHAFETVLLINNVDGLEPGLYQYVASQHALARLPAADDITERITRGCHNQVMVRSSAVTFIWVAITYRMIYRYTQRGYRYLLLDAGHVCQNLYLAAEAIRAGVCAIAAFDDDRLDAELGLDGADQFAIYVATVGKQR